MVSRKLCSRETESKGFMYLLSRRLVVGLLVLLTVGFCGGVVMAQGQVESGESWSVAVIPDTQYYVRNEHDAPIFTEVTKWLVANKEKLNLQLVLHVGDIVDRNKVEQWDRAKESLKVLDGELPYVLAVGNHDLGKNSSDRSTMLNDYVKISDNPLNEKIFGGYFEEGHLENAWYHFKYGGKDYIIFSLEFGPRDEVVAWADKVAAEHAGQRFMLVTHEFIDQESTLFSGDGMAVHSVHKTKNSPYSYGVSKIGSVNCGSELWDSFVGKYSNFDFVFNGHYKAFKKKEDKPGEVEALWDSLATSYRKDKYDDGRIVHQMMFNAQWAPKGGDGWIRILEFMPDGKTVKVRTVSPYLERVADDKGKAKKTGKDMEFELKLSGK